MTHAWIEQKRKNHHKNEEPNNNINKFLASKCKAGRKRTRKDWGRDSVGDVECGSRWWRISFNILVARLFKDSHEEKGETWVETFDGKSQCDHPTIHPFLFAPIGSNTLLRRGGGQAHETIDKWIPNYLKNLNWSPNDYCYYPRRRNLPKLKGTQQFAFSQRSPKILHLNAAKA